jgi:hypothetical protein
MNILENYKQTLKSSNSKITKHRILSEGDSMVSKGEPTSFNTHMDSASPIVKNQDNSQDDVTGNHHIKSYLEANREKKNKDVMSQVDRVENGIDRMHKVIEKLRKIIHELKHTYFQDQMPSSNPTGDGSPKK